jgi:uncharacterized protein with von Willebrand factor type A (vWA) domain
MTPGQATAKAAYLAENVMHFARVLRGAGIPLGSDRVLLALRALTLGGLEHRADFKATLAACLIDRPEQIAMFEQAFYVFWRDPDLLGRIMAMMLPRIEGNIGRPPPPENRRLADALFGRSEAQTPPDLPEQIELDATMTFSQAEILRKADFETMSSEEWASAKRMISRLVLQVARRRTRRFRSARGGRSLDWAATLRASARGGDLAALRFRKPRMRPAPLVVLADISGSMSKYSRMLLHFTHALSMSDVKVTSFVFGTRLTPISRQLRQRDPDLAVAAVVRQVEDWSGGTRITTCLHAFNRDWMRRVLAQNATLLLISDGLEHGPTEELEFEMDRLHRSCRQLVWLNPLLRFDGFEPRAAGIRAMLPHVDAFLPAHNLESLEALGHMLGPAIEN